MEQKRYQEGHWLSIGMGFGIIIGLVLGIPFYNSAIGLLIGIIIGGFAGFVLEKKLNPTPILLTKKQKRLKRIMIIIAFIIAFLIAIFLAITFP